jgi:hypothetical protein
MPKGIPIKDHLDEPDFKILYTTLKHTPLKETDFAQVAVEMGCKDAAFAYVPSSSPSHPLTILPADH